MQFSHQTAKLEGYLMLNMNLSNYNLIKYQSSIDFFFINTKVQKEKALQTKQTKANWIVPSTFRLSIQSRYFPITVISGVWKREISEFVLIKDLPKSTV